MPDREIVLWVATALILPVFGFLLSNFWENYKKLKEAKAEETDTDVSELKTTSQINAEHISKFRSEIGVLTNDVINRLSNMQENLRRQEKETDAMRSDLKSLENYFKDFLLKMGKS